MTKKSFYIKLKNLFSITAISLIGILCVVFIKLYVDTFNYGFINEFSFIISAISIGLINVITLLIICFYRANLGFIYKLFVFVLFIIFFTIITLYFLKKTGLIDKINSVEQFRGYVSSFGSLAVVIFIAFQFLQVVILPVPAIVSVGAGVLLFGPFKCAIYSFIGIVLGSIVAFYFGKIFGYKGVSWLIGKDNLDKSLKSIKGKDKLLLTFMFLFPFFPDDILCFVAGIASISPLFFIIMIIITRFISIFVSTFSMNNNLIPYNTWWGILLWVVFFVITIVLAIFIYKKGNDISKKLFKRKYCI